MEMGLPDCTEWLSNRVCREARYPTISGSQDPGAGSNPAGGTWPWRARGGVRHSFLNIE